MAKIRKKPKKNINKNININKKSFTQSTPNIAEKLDNEMVAFLDTEFLTSQIKGGPPAKLVSVGFVVCGKNFEEVTRFHSYIYAEDKLHDRFQEMTGIERKDLLSAPDYELVMEEVAEQLEAWEVSRIYVWGPDKYVIQRDLLEYRKDISKRTRKIVNRIFRMIKDIEGIYSAKLDLQSAGIGSLKIICGLGTEVSHNALDDAVDLKNIIRHIDLKGCSEHMLQIMKKYTAEKEVYYRLRRFREKWDDVSEAIQEKSLGLLKELGKVDTVEAMALRDDLLVMCTGEATAFPTLEEYIQKENAKTGIRNTNSEIIQNNI